MPTMQRRPFIIGASAAAIVVAAAAATFVTHHTTLFRREPQLTEQQWSALKGYCTDCHSAAEAAGDVVLEGVPASAIQASPKSSRRRCASCAAA